MSGTYIDCVHVNDTPVAAPKKKGDRSEVILRQFSRNFLSISCLFGFLFVLFAGSFIRFHLSSPGKGILQKSFSKLLYFLFLEFVFVKMVNYLVAVDASENARAAFHTALNMMKPEDHIYIMGVCEGTQNTSDDFICT